MATKAKTPADNRTDEQKKQAAYSSATQELRDRHRSEFVTLVKERYEEAGLEYKPRLTPEEKAAQDVQAILERFPHLRASVGGENVPSGGIAHNDESARQTADEA